MFFFHFFLGLFFSSWNFFIIICGVHYRSSSFLHASDFIQTEAQNKTRSREFLVISMHTYSVVCIFSVFFSSYQVSKILTKLKHMLSRQYRHRCRHVRFTCHVQLVYIPMCTCMRVLLCVLLLVSVCLTLSVKYT